MEFFCFTSIHYDSVGFADKEIRKEINTTKEEPYDIENLFQIEEVIDIVQIKCNTYYKKQS